MDDVGIQGWELEDTLREIAFLNRALGGYSPSLRGINALVPPSLENFSVLDVGSGAGDAAKEIVRWAEARGRRTEVLGIDLTDTTIAYARRQCAGFPSIDFQRQNLFALGPDQVFDVVHAGAVLHHFPGTQAVSALRKMFSHARYGLVVNDLHRHRLAWVGIKLLTSMGSKSRLVRYDAPLSVLRAFTRQELGQLAKEAELPEPEIAWRPVFRWQMVVRR